MDFQFDLLRLSKQAVVPLRKFDQSQAHANNLCLPNQADSGDHGNDRGRFRLCTAAG